MTYRPTVRYSDVFGEYVNSLFRATTLDRNQIIRAALFTAAHTSEFQKLLESYKKKKDVPLPHPSWCVEQHVLWLEQCPQIEKEGKDVNAIHSRTGETKTDSGIYKQQGSRLQETSSETNKYRRNKSFERSEGQISSQSKIHPKVITQSGGIRIKIG